MTRAAFACLAAAGAVFLTTAAQGADWQAVAYSPRTGQDGYSFGYASKAAAEKAAREACQAPDCAVMGSSRQCMALVATVDKDRVAALTIESRAVSTAAMCTDRGLANCQTLRTTCASDRRGTTVR